MHTQQVEGTVRTVPRHPEPYFLDRAVADAAQLEKEGKIAAALEKWRSIATIAERIDDEVISARAWFAVGNLLLDRGRRKGGTFCL